MGNNINEIITEPGDAMDAFKQLIEGAMQGGSFKTMEQYAHFKSAHDVLLSLVNNWQKEMR